MRRSSHSAATGGGYGLGTMIAERPTPGKDNTRGSPALKIAIIYEDFDSGMKARGFAECLADQLASTCELSNSLWRSELLAAPSIAEDATRAAAGCDYLIISLRGDRDLPPATREWIESHLAGSDGAGAGLIVLSDPLRGERRLFESTRRFLRAACATRGVAFFSHSATPSPEVEASDEDGTDELCWDAVGRPA